MDGSQVHDTARVVAQQEPLGSRAVSPLAALQRQRRGVFKAAAALSVLLHAGSLYALLSRVDNGEVGAIEALSEAITVELVESTTLESMVPKQRSEPAPAMEASAATEGRTEASDAKTAKAEERPEPEPDVVVPEPPLQPEKLARELTPPPVQPEAPAKNVASAPKEVLTEFVIEPPPAEKVEKDAPQPRQPPKRTEKKAAERAPKGGTISKAQAGRGAGGDRATASTGSILSYAAHVRARVAANKPSGGGLRGTATVHFGLTISGGLAFASVSRSSGSAALDQVAVSAVRQSVPFPPPPAGATATQLRFSIPFYFQ